MRQRRPELARPPPALAAALDRVGDRWSLLLVDALLDGPRRFNELGDALPGIAPNILTDRLRRLEREGIVVATPYTNRPPRMEYSLTADGRDLASALRLLADWGARHVARRRAAPPRPLWHAARGALVLPDLRDGGQRRRRRDEPRSRARSERARAARAGAPGCRRHLPTRTMPVIRE